MSAAATDLLTDLAEAVRGVRAVEIQRLDLELQELAVVVLERTTVPRPPKPNPAATLWCGHDHGQAAYDDQGAEICRACNPETPTVRVGDVVWLDLREVKVEDLEPGRFVTFEAGGEKRIRTWRGFLRGLGVR
jgi:hypothetical protein